MANKRIKKKQSKKALQNKAKSLGKSQKQVQGKTIAELSSIIKKEEKNRKAREAYAEDKRLIEKYNLKGFKPGRERKKLREAARRVEEKRKQKIDLNSLDSTRRKKAEWLKERHIPFTKSDLNRPWADIYKMYGQDLKTKGEKIYSSPVQLYIGFYDKSGNIDLLRHQSFYDGMTVQELKRAVEEALHHRGESGSDGRAGDIIIQTLSGGFNPNNYGFIIRRNEKKGYQTIMLNEFTLHGALKITCALLDNCREDEKQFIYDSLAGYFRTYLPELYKRWR